MIDIYTHNYIINNYFYTKEIVKSKDYRVTTIKIGDTQNLSSYILIKNNLESVSLSKSRKKSKGHYSEVIFSGLRQPTKKITIDTYSILIKFIKRFKVSNIDICFDGLNDVEVTRASYFKLDYIFKDYIASKTDTNFIYTTFYINRPSNKLSDSDRFKKIVVYDKYIKECRVKNIDRELKNWKRIEVTVNIDFKLNGFNLDESIQDIEPVAKHYFNTSSFNYTYLDLQLKLLEDKRTHKRKDIAL